MTMTVIIFMKNFSRNVQFQVWIHINRYIIQLKIQSICLWNGNINNRIKEILMDISMIRSTQDDFSYERLNVFVWTKAGIEIETRRQYQVFIIKM